MLAAVLQDNMKCEICEIPMPQIGKNQVLIKVLVCGVCVSEMHNWQNGKNFKNRILGHEVVGVIEKTGHEVTKVKVGDRVTGIILQGFAEYTVAEESKVCIVPECLSDEEAIVEPLACVVSGMQRTEILLGDKVGILGIGYMGLLCLQLVKASGACNITCFDIRQDALDHALKFGAVKVYNTKELPQELRVINFGENKGLGFDVFFETSGVQKGLDISGELVSVHGILSILGYHQGNNRYVNMEMWNWKAFTVINAHERRHDNKLNCIMRSLKLIENKYVDTKSLMTHSYELNQIDDAFKITLDKPHGFIKSYVKIGNR